MYISCQTAGRAFLHLSLVMAVAACASSRGGPIPYEVEDFSAPDPAGVAIQSSDNLLVPGDKLKIVVFGVEDLTGDFNVDLAGNIAYPLIGTLAVAGMTSSQLADEIEVRLGQRYLRDPHVTVAISESADRQVAVEGAVREPGVFDVTGPTTLLEAVARARGLDESANPRRVAVFRRIDGQRMAAAFDLTSIRRGQMDDPQIYAGDVVVVDGTRTRTLLRDLIATLPVIALFRPY